jgi:hypothetical protein
MSCIVIYGDNGSIVGTQTPKEETSKLFPEVLNKVRNEKRAADLVALTYTEKFVEQVISPLKSKYKTAIKRNLDTLQPSNSIINLLHKGKEYSADIKNLLYKTVEVNGFTTIQAFVKAGEENVMLGKVRMKPYKNGLAIESTNLSTAQVYNQGNIEGLQGKGIGTEMYKYAILKVISQNKPFYSDANQTPAANGVWDKLKSTKIVKREDGRNKIESTPSSHFDSNGEVLPQVLFNYLRGEQAKGKKLSFEQKQDIKNSLLSLPFEDSQEMADALEKSFYDENGEFKVEEKKLKDFYTSYEILNIKTDRELQKSIKNIIESLRNIDEVFTKETYFSNDFLVKRSTINSLGKLVNNNPLATEKNVIQELGGVKDREEFISKAESLELPQVLKQATVESKEVEAPKKELPKKIVKEIRIIEEEVLPLPEVSKLELIKLPLISVSEITNAKTSKDMTRIKLAQEKLKKEWQDLEELNNCAWS